MKLKAAHAMYVAIFFILIGVSFQNCGKGGFSESEDLQTIHFSSVGMNAPFAFETKVDQITYMSCFAGSAPNDSAFFTLKVGAFRPNAGMKLRPELLTYAKTQIKPIYPSTDISLAQLNQVLSESPQNIMAIPRLALRNRYNIQSPVGNQGFALGLDIISLLGNLSSENYMASYVSKEMLSTTAPNTSSFVQYFPLAPGNSEGQRRLDGTLKFDLNGSGESLLAQVRKNLSDSPNNPDEATILTITYPPYPGVETEARAPASDKPDKKVAYGIGFDLKFSQLPAPTPHSQNPQNVLTSVNEFDLENSKRPPVANWDCSRRYKIVRNADAKEVCPSFEYPFPQPNDRPEDLLARRWWREEIEIAYNQLDPALWEINPQLRCAYPKSPNSSCYNENHRDGNGLFLGVQYDNSQPCLRGIDDTGLNAMNYSPPYPTKLCAQYISICVRN